MTNPLPDSPSPLQGPQVVIDEKANVEDMAQSVRVIEGLFHAINAASFPLKVYQDVMLGMQFLKAVHDGIINKLGPDEIARIRQSEAFKATAQTAEPTGKAN